MTPRYTTLRPGPNPSSAPSIEVSHSAVEMTALGLPPILRLTKDPRFRPPDSRPFILGEGRLKIAEGD